MASTATTILGLRKQGTGDAEDTWGTELNEDALDLIDEAHGVESIALTGNKTLTSTDYVTNEARNAALRLTDGGLSAAPTITIPAVEKTYLVQNTTTYVVTFSSGGTDATVSAQRWALVYCDGTDVYAQKLFQSEDQASYGGAYEYAFSTTTTDADPGAGVLRLDNATASSATGIYVSDNEAGGADISALLLTWDDSTSTVKGYVKLQSKATPATFYVYSVSALTDNSGYMDFTISPLAGTGTLANNEEVVLSFFRTGDKGETGATGATGAVAAAGDGTAAAPGIAWASDTDTGFYRSASGETSYSANNSQVLALNATGATLLDNTLTRPKLLDYGEMLNPIGSIGGGTQDIDLESGNVVSGTVDTSTTTFTFSNPPATGAAGSFTLYLTNGGSQTVNWPASVDWEAATAPTLTASGLDILVFSTLDGGTTWYGAVAGLDVS